MANLSKDDLGLLLNLFIIDGKVLNLPEEDFYKYFKFMFDVDLSTPRFRFNQNTAEDRFVLYLGKESDHNVYIVIKVILKYFTNAIKVGEIEITSTTDERVSKVVDLLDQIGLIDNIIINSYAQYAVLFNIYDIHADIYDKITDKLYEENYLEAVKDAIKIVERKVKKLEKIDNLYQLTNRENLNRLLKVLPKKRSDEEQYVTGMLYQISSILKFRNYITHSECTKIDEKEAMHYIYLLSLTCHFIDNELKK